MATQDPQVLVYSFEAGADLTGKQYHFVELNSSGQAVLANATGDAIGILQNKPNTTQAATVCVLGVSKVVADEALAINDKVLCSSDAQAAKATAGAHETSVLGRVTVAAGSGGLATAFVNCINLGVPAAT